MPLHRLKQARVFKFLSLKATKEVPPKSEQIDKERGYLPLML